MSEINVVPQNTESGANTLAIMTIVILFLAVIAYVAYSKGWFMMQTAATSQTPNQNINVTIPNPIIPTTLPAPTPTTPPIQNPPLNSNSPITK